MCIVGLIRTLTFPSMSLLTGWKAIEPNTSGLVSVNLHRETIPHTKHSGQGLGSFQELARRYGIVLLLIDRDVREGSLHSVEEGAAGRVCFRGRHCDFEGVCVALEWNWSCSRVAVEQGGG